MAEDENESIERAIDALCAKHITEEYLRSCDEHQRYPTEAMTALADAGWARLAVAQRHGGDGATVSQLAAVHIALARWSIVISQAYFSMWVLGAGLIERMGNTEQQARWLPRIAKGQALIGFALTEPGGGSDARALRTEAVGADGGWRVNGQKVFITGAAVSDTILTVVRTRGAESDGLSLVMIDPASPGVTLRRLPKIGLKALDLCEVFLDDVAVPDADVVGPVGEAWSGIRVGLAAERTFLAAICTGGLEQVVSLSADYARERRAFGRPIGQHQMVGQKIVDMAVAARVSRLLTLDAAAAVDAGGAAEVAASMAKLYASEAYVSAVRDGVQVFGGYGYTEELPIARHYRDAKYLEIGGGSSEVQRIIVGRSLGLM